MRKHGLIVAMALLLFPIAVLAQYVVGPSVIAGGGARMTGGGYVITGTTGQSAPVGVSAGGAYQTHHGFWHAVTGGGGGALDPMVLDLYLISATTYRIDWGAIAGATHYDLYQSTIPFFNAGSVWRTVTAPDTHTNTTWGVGNTNTNYFYLGKARNATDTSPESNIVGEMDYGADIPLMRTDSSGNESER